VTFHAEYAWVDGAVARDVLIEVAGGRFTRVLPDMPAGNSTRLPGLVLPGFANVHSHAFHRALRGRTHGGRGSFWTWRERMYEVAGRLDPDGYYALARAVYGEMALAGITCVGEFHYLHHNADGTPYADPNAMGEALIEAARVAGIRITLLDALYLTSTVDGAPLEGVQRRFGDGDLDAWVARVDRLRPGPYVKIGAAIHSVRAVPERFLAGMTGRGPLHVHVSEQRAENEQTQAFYGGTPTQLLERNGVLGADTTAVHATHLTPDDITLLAGSGVCFCPTTERDLADGIGPAGALAAAGARLSLGSDSQAVIDMFAEAQALEAGERLATERRGHFNAAELIGAATDHAALGWDDAGAIAAGNRADLVAVSLDSVRVAGVDPAALVHAATAADVTHVVVEGRHVVSDGHHIGFDVPAALRKALA
jgi:formiminoglutamate deiminase